jgi:hypothetical protein
MQHRTPAGLVWCPRMPLTHTAAHAHTGRSNMYPTVPKAYEAGNIAEDEDASATLLYALGGAAVAAGLIVTALVSSGSGRQYPLQGN